MTVDDLRELIGLYARYIRLTTSRPDHDKELRELRLRLIAMELEIK